MKKHPSPLSTLLTILSLTSVAHADAIVTPFDRFTAGTYSAAPWLLILALAGLTLLLLFKFKKRK